MENNEEVTLTNIIGYMKFKSQFYGLNKKIKNVRKSGSKFEGIVKVTLKKDPIIPNINICKQIKRPMSIMYKQISRIISQNPEYLKTFCNDRNNHFHIGCRRWIPVI